MLIGIVGKPNVGKSTFFRALTSAYAESANYPFTTIEPNKGVGFVRVKDVGPELGVISNPRTGYVANGNRYVGVDVIDVAGLVPGAHEGKGLGNKFLDDLRVADVLIHVVDISGSTNEKGETVDIGSYDPLNDITFLEHELDMWIFQVLDKNWEKVAKTQSSKKQKIVDALKDVVSGLSIKQYQLDKALKGKKEIMIDWTKEEIKLFANELRTTSKPIVIAANKMDLSTASQNVKRIKEKYPNLIIIPTSAESEVALKEASKAGLISYNPGESNFTINDLTKLSDKQKKALEFIESKILNTYGNTGVQQIVEAAVFEKLGYIAIFPGGVNKLGDSQGRILPDCFLLPPNSTALDFAYHIHSDLGDTFIKAILVKTKMMVGKEHPLQNRDVIEIVSGK